MSNYSFKGELDGLVYEGASNALFELVPRIMKSVGCGESRKETGLTFNQIRALNFLASQKRYLGDIAEDRGVSPASASALVDSLQKSGLVDREIDSVDNRKVLIGLTPHGRKTYDQLKAVSLEQLKEIISVLGREDAEEFSRLLQKMNGRDVL